MKRYIFASLFLMFAAAAFAQERPAAGAPAGGRGGARTPQPPPPLFFKESWKDIPDNVPLTQEFVMSPNLQLSMFGPGKEDFHITNEGTVPHIWTGLSEGAIVLALSNKETYVDLSGKGRVRWYTKTSGFHEIRPVVKLADGTWYVGDHVDANTFDYHESEFYPAELRWLKLDMPKVQTKGVLVDKIDLSRVDAVGFGDLTAGSGHGNGGYSDVGWIEVYGKPVKR